MAVTTFEKGIEKGIEKGRQEGRLEGRQEGQRELLKQMLEDRFGALPNQVSAIIDTWPERSFRKLARLVGQVQSLDELKQAAKHK